MSENDGVKKTMECPGGQAACASHGRRQVSESLLRAIGLHFEAKHQRALANFSNYMANSAGVGEHPDIVEECIKLLEDIDHAESVLDTLEGICG